MALVVLVLTVIACGRGGGDQVGGPTLEITGHVHAGPICPVESVPPDPACADRAVVGAVMIVTDRDGSSVAETVTDADGDFSVSLPDGDYVLVPQPVEGLMGTAQPQPFVAALGTPPLDVRYDTGIR